MSPHVSCDDCSWSDDYDSLLEASEDAEDHEAKEQHRVSIDRVATDGGELSDETVYVRGANHGGNPLVLHTDRDCSRLSNARTVLSRSRDTYPDDVPVCEWCTGSVEHAGGANDGPWKDLEAADPDDLATDGGEPSDYAWIVTCPHDERIVVEDDLEAAVLDWSGVYEVTIAVAAGEQPADDDIDRKPVLADGGYRDAGRLAEDVEAELLSRVWDRDDQQLVFKSASVAADLEMPVEQFNVGLRHLRQREDTRLEIERWNGESNASPWQATLADQRVAADGGRPPGGAAAPPEPTPLPGQQLCPACEAIRSGDDVYCAECGEELEAGDVPVLEFAEEYVPAIVRGDKNATVRYGDDGADVDVGDTVRFVDEDGVAFGRIAIDRTATVLAVEALSVLKVFGAEYPTDDVDELIAGINQHYDDGIKPGTTVRVICWESLQYQGGSDDV